MGNNAVEIIESIIDGISAFRDELISPDELDAYLTAKKGRLQELSVEEREYLDKLSDLLKVYRAYETYKRAENLLDFDDMIHEAVRLFDKRPAILRRYRSRFTHILVDEFQDTNYAQLQLIKQLAGDHLCVVGDDDQTIYRFRGAYLTNMQDYKQHFPGCTECLLEENYRSTQTILTLALQLMQHAPEPPPETADHRKSTGRAGDGCGMPGRTERGCVRGRGDPAAGRDTLLFPDRRS